MSNALGYFQKAIAIEPNYAPAHAGLAMAYISSSGWMGPWSPTNGVPLGKAAAQKAIELDPTLADAYVARGYARLNFDWDCKNAEQDFQQALKLSPRSPLALDAYANALVARAEFDQAVAALTNALELDLLSPALHYELGWTYFMARRFDRAIPCFHKALALDQSFVLGRVMLGYSYILTDRTNEALAEFQTALQLAPNWQLVQASLGYVYGKMGRRPEALQVLADLTRLEPNRYVRPWSCVLVYFGLGQTDAALNWVEKAYHERDGELSMWTVDPNCAPLRTEPRFQALLKKMGCVK
jgi:tetratricopeptide (TPR) repeat protein